MRNPVKATSKPARFWLLLNAVTSLLLLMVTASPSSRGAQARGEDSAVKTGVPAPAFNVVSLDGTPLQLADLRGQVVVLNFWFIACPPCRVEIPKLNQLVEEYQGANVVFIAFSPDSEEELREFQKTTRFDYHIIPDSTPVAQQYGVTGAPTHILIDREGIIRAVRYGEVSDPKAELSRSIAQIL